MAEPAVFGAVVLFAGAEAAEHPVGVLVWVGGGEVVTSGFCVSGAEDWRGEDDGMVLVWKGAGKTHLSQAKTLEQQLNLQIEVRKNNQPHYAPTSLNQQNHT